MMVSAILIGVFFLLILQVRSFEIGISDVWLLRWRNPAGVPFSIGWNMPLLLLVAATIGLIRVLLPPKRSANRDRR
jgi:Flp pilus assembly protein protease CpaA